MHQVTEDRLWMLCLEGNREAFKELYCRFYPSLYNYGLKWVSEKELVEDCIHDIFIKIMQNHAQLSPTPNLKGYLLKTLRNKIWDTLEKENRMDDLDDYRDCFAVALSEEEESAERIRFLMQAFSELSSRQKEIVYLYYIDGLKHEEIAEIMGINYQSSKNLLFRSLSKLRELFAGKKNLPLSE